MTRVWIAVLAGAAGVAWLLAVGGGASDAAPGRLGAVRAAVFVLAVAVAAGLARVRLRSRQRATETHPNRQAAAVFLVLALGAAVLAPGRTAAFWWAWGAAVVAGPPVLGWLVDTAGRRFPAAAGGAAAGLLLVVLAGHFLLLFPPDTWRHAVLADDYAIVHYNTGCELDSIAAGGLWGWDDCVEGGRSLFLNLRTLAPLVWPVLGLGREVALHVLYLVSWLAFPLLVGAGLSAALRPRTGVGARVAFRWGVVAGVLFVLTYSANLLRFGMIYSMVAVDLLLLQFFLLERTLRGGRFAALGLGVAVGLGVYVHVAQQAMSVAFLAILCASRVAAERRVGPWKLLAGAALVAVGLSLPFWAQFWIHREFLAVRYLMGVSPVLAALAEAGPLGTARFLVTAVLWDFPGYFRLLVIGLPLAGLAVAGVRVRLGGHALLVVLVGLSMFAAWIPAWGHAMLRLHLLIPPVLALLAGDALRTSRGWGRGAVLTGLLLAVVGMPDLELRPAPHYSAPSLEVAEPALVGKVRDLPGCRVLFENSAGQSPLKDLTAPYDIYPGTEVQRGGLLAVAARRDLFAHAGWDPYPYHRLRDAFVVNGAWQGDPMADVDEAAFERALARYGVGGIVVWSPGARRYFGARPDRYFRLGEVPALERRLPVIGSGLWRRLHAASGGLIPLPAEGAVRVPSYAVFLRAEADGRAVRAEGGEAEVVSRGPFHRVVSVRGVRAGTWIALVTRHLPGWRATDEEGRALATRRAADGLLAFQAPRDGAVQVRLDYDRRARDWLGGGGVVALGLALCLTGRRKRAAPAEEHAR
ncbi:MAG: hypothetical protein JXQ29_02580 [Planctomycetes bacterium]|nr:hypothetical protein [Planctomycetota bacterium]